MAKRTVNIILDRKERCLYKSLLDLTPVSAADILEPIFQDEVNCNLFIGERQQGRFVTSDYSSDTIRAGISRGPRPPEMGSCVFSYGGDSTSALEFPLSAATVEAALNSTAAMITSGGCEVEMDPDGITYRIQGKTEVDLTAISVSQLDAVPPATSVVDVVTAGSGSAREVQLVTIREAALTLTDSWSAVSASVASHTTIVAADTTDVGVSDLALSNFPSGGSVVLDVNSNYKIWRPLEHSEQELKTLLTSVAANVSDVSRIEDYKWRVTANAVDTDLNLDIDNDESLTSHGGVTAVLQLNSTSVAAVCRGRKETPVTLTIRTTDQSSSDAEEIFREELILRGAELSLDNIATLSPTKPPLSQNDGIKVLHSISGVTGGTSSDLDSLSTAAGGDYTTNDTVMLLLTTGIQIWRLGAGTTAENEAGGIVRPDDYAASTNEKIWTRYA